ncbi:MAG: hypothetical protein ACI4KF_08000 [Huintestinicola sp.]
MRYDFSMTQFHGDIVAALKLMCGKDKVAESYVDEASPAPLRNYLKSKYANSGKGEPGGAHYSSTPSKGVDIYFDRAVNNDGDMTLTLSWSQAAKFIRDNPSEIFSEDEPADDILSDKKSLELLYNTFDESEIKCPFWRTGQTMRYLSFGGVDFKCDHCESSFCEFDKLTSFLASHCHNYEDCLYYRKHKDDKSNFPCDDCGYDVNKCCSYPDTPDDYCVCGDKKIPVPAQSETNVAAFDYSELDADTAAKLENVTAEIFNVRKEYIFTMAKKVAYAHDLLANHYGGKFGVWCESIGISRDTGNNLVRVAEIFGNISAEEQKNLSQLKPSLLYEAARPSAPTELVEQVKSGDITTHKEFIELKKQLENIKEDLEISKMEAEHCEERATYAEEQVTKLSVKNTELANQIKDLESRPIDVATPDDEEIDRMARERAQGLLRAKDTEWQKRLDEVQLQLRDVQSKLLDSAFETNAPDTEQLKEFYEYLHGNALSAIKSCFDFIHGGKVTGSAAADIKARLRSLKEVINDYLEEMK